MQKLAFQVGLLLVTAPLALGARPRQEAPAADPEGIEFFEKKIRPVLVDRCYTCHSQGAQKLKGKLLLDSREGALRGGESGPAVVPGDLEKSLLIKAVRYQDENLQMPPKGRLSPPVVADLEAWVKRGAPDPRGKPQGTADLDLAKARRHWAFQPPKEAPLPKIKRASWVKNGIDAFILEKLEEKGLEPQAAADPRTLLRRVTFDLLGIPPTPEEVDAFVADPSPRAYSKVLDRLLGSPLYGERWGRHWLDVARYSDTKGYVFREERRYPFSYTYRDWVIRALNDDLPYDQFLIQQIAADRLPPGPDKGPLAAMGFLTLGRRFINNIHDIIDDRIDVVCRGTMALTVGCARCHDHKFDPIPTKDYYSIYGVFASSTEPKDLPQIDPPQKTAEMIDYEKQVEAQKAEAARYREDRYRELLPALRTPKAIASALQAAREAQDLGAEEKLRGLAQKYEVTVLVIERWKAALKAAESRKDPVFAAWRAYAALPEKEFAAAAAKVSPEGHPKVAQAMSAKPPQSLKEVAERYGELLARAAGPAAASGDAEDLELRQILLGPDSPTNVALADVEKLFNRAHREKLQDLTRKVDQLQVTHPGAPAHAMVLVDNPAPTAPHVFIRGNPNNRGEEIPRQFLGILSPRGRQPFRDGSGRLELARAIASPENPLTARVMVNRVWIGHFGAGLVRTPSDFGLRSDPPTHPELLDWLAVRFMAEGWSLKKLHRLILESSTYRQGSSENPRTRQMDPDNRLVWRVNRQRLDFEAMRDSLLAASGQLDLTPGGRPAAWSSAHGVNQKMEGETIRNVAGGADPGQEIFSRRRTVYLFIDRQNLMGTYRDFDFASPDTHSPMRFTTTVPQQALFLMNSGFVVDQARALAARPQIAGTRDPEMRIRQLYRLLFGRLPTPEELAVGRRFVETEESRHPDVVAAATSAWQYGYGRFDETAKRTAGFTPLPHWTGMAYQGGPKLPDPKLGWVLLTAEGGHPGGDPDHAAIRRWTAPRDGAVSIGGTLVHKAQEGDGVRGRIVSSSQGELASWTAHHTEAETRMSRVEVKQGDTIDFIVDCRANESFDSFGWAPVIRMIEAPAALAGGDVVLEWSSAANFSGPPGKPRKALQAWEKYAQVLLLTNEFMFVD
jgi:hypothetical protein